MPTYSRSIIANMIATDYRWLTRAIVAIWHRQTTTEQARGVTLEDNGVGFNGCDAPFLTSLAEQIQQGRRLSEKQLVIARRKMQKYCGQLSRIAEENRR